MTVIDYRRLHGRDQPPAELRELRAGPVTVLLEGIDLRYARFGPVELLRRLYVAVRDESWGTLPGEVSNLDLDARDESFTLEFDARHRAAALDFIWHGRIEGVEDGTIRCSMHGRAQSDFRYNRIGFCVLHPPRENAGRPYRAEAPAGPISGTLPDLIGPQRIEDGALQPVFPSFSSLAIELAGGGEVRLDFEGDLFEMEDQRNWIDGSFKTYSTPLALGFPHEARAGQEITQSVTISVAGLAAPAAATDEHVRLSLGRGTGRPLPSIGLGIASHGEPLAPRELELLRRLRLDHLRVDLHLADARFAQELDRAARESEALGCSLEIALFLTEEQGDGLAKLAGLLGGTRTARFLVFGEGARANTPTETSPGRLVELARTHLEAAAPGAPLAGGTDMYFCQLNRTRPEIDAMQAVYWSMHPQVHASDDLSLMETLEAQADTVRTARSFSGDRPLVVSPITLKARWNPYAAAPESEPAPDTLPPQVDPRQASLFGAAWTLGSVKYLAESGAASLTYYETTGWRGVLERESGSPLPELFPSSPGEPFPLYTVFAQLAERKSAELVECASSEPLRVIGLALRDASGTHVLVANLTPRAQRAAVDGEPPIELGPYEVRHLHPHGP